MNRNGKHPDDENRRRESENHQVGRDIYRDRGDQPFTSQYRSGQKYHNREEGYGPDQTHYGARPDSVYRNPNINFGDNRQQRSEDQGYRDRQERFRNNQQQQSQPPREYPDHTRPEQHHDHRYYTERNDYKDTDYRYRSGNRGDWHAPGDFLEGDRHDNRRNDRHQDEGFFDRMGNSISNAWNRMIKSDDDYNNQYNQQHRYTPRGYESGPRWADESDNDRYEREQRYRRRNNQDDY